MESQGWQRRLSKYRSQNNYRGLAELALTLVAFAALWAAFWFVSQHNYWLALLLAPLAAGFLVRIFLMQHECGHGTLFSPRSINDWVGRCLGVLTFTPYDYWRDSHAQHHAGSGNLDRRGIGDIGLLTVSEYLARGPMGRLMYRIYRHPLVMFGLGPTYLFVFQHRFPLVVLRGSRAGLVSTFATNASIAALVVIMGVLVGWGDFLKVQVPITVLASSLGVWLFYVQHQFEKTFWAHTPEWSANSAALRGSSFYDLPAPLHWLTANIGFHHLHHLSSRIPFYQLPKVMKEWPELGEVRRLGLIESTQCVRLTLWDEVANRLVSFKQATAGAA